MNLRSSPRSEWKEADEPLPNLVPITFSSNMSNLYSFCNCKTGTHLTPVDTGTLDDQMTQSAAQPVTFKLPYIYMTRTPELECFLLSEKYCVHA